MWPWCTISVYAEMSPEVNVTNKGVAALFKVSPSNLHKLVSGKKYHGGSHGDSRKVSLLKEVEDHGEPMVQVIKKKMVKSMTSRSGTSTSGGKGRKTQVVRKGDGDKDDTEDYTSTILGR